MLLRVMSSCLCSSISLWICAFNISCSAIPSTAEAIAIAYNIPNILAIIIYYISCIKVSRYILLVLDTLTKSDIKQKKVVSAVIGIDLETADIFASNLAAGLMNISNVSIPKSLINIRQMKKNLIAVKQQVMSGVYEIMINIRKNLVRKRRKSLADHRANWDIS